MYFEVTKYNDNLYQLKDKLGVLSTLVIGKDKALVFDTCYGIGNLKEKIRQITDKELVVVVSHGHMDHACGNYQFDEVFINKKDFELCHEENGINKRKRNIENAKKINALPADFDEEKYLNAGYGKLKEINYGDIIDLGGISFETYNMEGHTLGSIGLYSKELKLMLVSDAACPFVWIFFDESAPLHVYKATLERILKLDFDNFLVGHGAKLYPKDKMEEFLDCANKLDVSKSFKVPFGEKAYCFTEGELYGPTSCGIIFDKNKL